ncbi:MULTISPECIES: hypothetical protein [Streptomyces]|uniref:Uncharacterized protein n=1 Tax=Streptomyces tsukubensis (strain DSM 42081 / NBRC 108919 / NRRL 18488 / 9993) TaxID=1114943 RepID=I2MZ20_STRT9|nr:MULTISPECIES: hypothetical protein [Streptomyces]AZK94302.1 hypothetical protein B7R87_10835 [Streptomyces tsukubensis]EIF90017.1 hypothetical protein [Streptomyces tsukubensis NRRL18488]MYS68247.1 hypothetical protein [Streptomyces sp. SID5473]QKM69603.1 hypothetical protein STSU_022955 [Streptomyces tsukubensis NRRL18488]TAI46437.1 hypothetical protein EWI31_05200 [Streptomyces tsukubensis]
MDRSVTPNQPLNAEDYCDIYVDCRYQDVAEEVLKRLGAVKSGRRSLSYAVLLIDVAHNGYEGHGCADAPAFLDWPTVLECEVVAGADFAEVVSAFASVLAAFLRGGWQAQAVGEIEEEIRRYFEETEVSG